MGPSEAELGHWDCLALGGSLRPSQAPVGKRGVRLTHPLPAHSAFLDVLLLPLGLLVGSDRAPVCSLVMTPRSAPRGGLEALSLCGAGRGGQQAG